MATFAQQLFVRTAATERSGPIDTAVAGGVVNAGDMVYWTGLGWASLSNAGANNANAASFVGVSRDTYPIPVAGIGTPGQLYAPQAAAFEYAPSNVLQVIPSATVTVEGEFSFKTTPGQTYVPFAAVYLGADGQTVSTTVLGTRIGTVAIDQRPVGSSLGGSVLGFVGQSVAIRISPVVA